MNTDLTRRLAVFLFGCLPALVAAQESAVTTSSGLWLVQTDSEKATRMLQLRWRSEPTGSATREDLFWFAEYKSQPGDQAMTEKDAFIISGSCCRMSITDADGLDGWSHTSIGVEEISATQIVIKVDRTKGLWKAVDKEPVTQLDEVLKVPLRNVGPTTQGKIEFTARWWGLAQPFRAPEPRSGQSKMETSSGAAR